MGKVCARGLPFLVVAAKCPCVKEGHMEGFQSRDLLKVLIGRVEPLQTRVDPLGNLLGPAVDCRVSM